MESSVDQRLSLLLDGEASEFETRRLVEDISKNPHIKRRWLEMNKQKSALRRELLIPNLDLSSKIQNELQKSKKTINQKHHKYHFRWGKIPYLVNLLLTDYTHIHSASLSIADSSTDQFHCKIQSSPTTVFRIQPEFESVSTAGAGPRPV